MKARSSERGSQLIEFALVLPLLLLIIAGIAEFGLLFHAAEITGNAAREGARLAVIPGNETDGYATVISRVNGFLSDSGLTGLHETVAQPESIAIGGGLVSTGVRVTVTYTYPCRFLRPIAALMNGTFAPTITYNSTALMRTEVAAVAP